MITSGIAIATMWLWMYQPRFGLFNEVLGLFGVAPIPWLRSIQWAMPSLIIMAIWGGGGYSTIIFIAGLRGIPMPGAVAGRLNDFARIPVCGLIAGYNARSREELASEMMMADLMRAILVKRWRIEGFIVSDYWAETMPKFVADMAKWQTENPLGYREDVTEGLENAPQAFIGLLEGKNFGKAVVKVA